MRFAILLITTLLLPLLGFSTETGLASLYSVKSNRGTVTASGIPLNDSKLTAAHKTLKLGTKVLVTCLKTNKQVVVTITDRGPYIRNRIIDLTPAAGKAIGLDMKKGLTKVTITPLKPKS